MSKQTLVPSFILLVTAAQAAKAIKDRKTLIDVLCHQIF